jgi:hypothetical protein
MASKTTDERTLKQFRVFTEWVNYRLERANQKPIKSLTKDLQDGTALVCVMVLDGCYNNHHYHNLL